jgi:hypothetical protein
MTTDADVTGTVEFEFQGFEEGEEAQAEQVADQVRAEGGQAEVTGQDGADFAFIPIILGAMAVVGLVHVIKNLLDDFQVGVVIDTRNGKVVTTKDKNLPRGTVVVVSEDGQSVTLEQPDKETLNDAVKAAVAANG